MATAKVAVQSKPAQSKAAEPERPANSQSLALCCPPLLGPVLDDDDAADLAGMLKALADPIRLKLVNLISQGGEACACDLPAALDRSQPTISHHLTILVKAGLIDREQRGKWAWFRLNQDRLEELRSALG